MTGTNPARRNRPTLSIACWAFAMTLLWAVESAAAPFAYVLNRGSEDVSVIDLFTATEIAIMDVRYPGLPADFNAEPREMILHPSEPELYVLADGYVAIVNVETLDPADTRFVSLTVADARGFALDSTGDFLYVSYKDAPTLTEIDTSTLVPTDSTLSNIAGLRHLGISGSILFGVNKTGSILRMDLNSGVGRIIGTGIFKRPQDLTISANGQEVFVAVELQEAVYVFDVNATTINLQNISRVANRFVPGRVRAFPNGSVAVIDRTYFEVDFIRSTARLDFPIGLEPRDIDENETGTRVVALENTASGQSGMGILEINSRLGYIDVPVGAKPRAIEMSRSIGELTISPSPVTFKYVKSGDIVRRDVTIRNTGDRDVAIRDIDVASSGPFRAVMDNCPRSLAPASSCTATVEFTAKALSRGCSLAIVSVLCILQDLSYQGFLKVDNDALSNPVTGVALQAVHITSNDIRDYVGENFAL